MTTKEIADRIRDDYGTVRHFCKKHGINPSTYNVVICGFGSSLKVTEALISSGYIQSAADMPRRKSA